MSWFFLLIFTFIRTADQKGNGRSKKLDELGERGSKEDTPRLPADARSQVSSLKFLNRIKINKKKLKTKKNFSLVRAGAFCFRGGGGQIRTPQDPPPGKVKNSGGVWTPPPGKVKNSGGVRAKKARCSLAMESTKKLAKILTGLFSSKTTQNLRRNYTSFELTLFLEVPHFPWVH